MSKRQVIILWVIAIVLGLTVATVKFAQQDSNQNATECKAGETLLADFPVADIAEITIVGVTDTTILKKVGDLWVVANRDDYPADTSSVYEFIRMTADLKVTRCIEADPSFAPRFGMDEKSTNSNERGIMITFKDKTGKECATITLGKNIENDRSASQLGGNATVGRYIRNHADTSGFYATSQLFPSISYHPEIWLNDDFISPEKIQSITLSKADSEEAAWTVSRESEEAEFQMAGTTADEVLNTTTATPLKSLFSYSRFDDVVPSSELANRTQPKGKRIATITTFEGFTYTLSITPELGVDNKYLMTVSVDATLPEKRKAADGESAEDAKAKDKAFTTRLKSLTRKLERAQSYEGRVYQVSKSTVEPLLKERSDLLTKATTGNPTQPETPKP